MVKIGRDYPIMGQTASNISTSSADDYPTPTSPIMTDSMFSDEKTPIDAIPHVEHHPVANRPFMIRTRLLPHRYLFLDDGKLKLSDNLKIGGGWLWLCLKNRGWYGFRNTASGAYLGHSWCNGIGKLLAKASHHKTDEHFMTDRQIDGGYTLLARKGDQLLPIVISESDELLLGQAEENNAMGWEFVDARFINLNDLKLRYF